ncbi:hypothetical protein M5225_000264 [Vibrio vulnificus]|nr:hypothetical protein [Vibrio vulnificus]EHH1188651.1 hypothetical protein [Vibrio vulnificus]EHU4846324.1 hypothetical protein [Vibrio vulnificus]EHZ2900087.1 hypothetical protein [Vibrio vulnificus]EIA1302918.1 hypothetical protein [Vibrio vulnificus]
MGTNNTTPTVKSTDFRELKFIREYLVTKDVIPRRVPIPTSPSEFREQINEYLRREKAPDLNYIVKDAHDKFRSTKLSNQQISNLDRNDPRFCFWVWCYLRHAVGMESRKHRSMVGIPKSDPSFDSNRKDRVNLYELLQLPTSPRNHAERYEAIVDFFDNWRATNQEKLAFIESLIDRWQKLDKFDQKKDLSWLDRKNVDQCNWVINYLITAKVPVYEIPEPLSSEEKFHTAIAVLDYWEPDHPLVKRDLFRKLRKAWSQQKHRSKMKGRKAYSVVMDTDIKGKLDTMAAVHGMNKNDFLQWLINQEYSDGDYSNNKE